MFVWKSRNTNENVRILLLPTAGRQHTILGLLCLFLATRGIVNGGHEISVFALCWLASIFLTDKCSRMGIPIQIFLLTFFQNPTSIVHQLFISVFSSGFHPMKLTDCALVLLKNRCVFDLRTLTTLVNIPWNLYFNNFEAKSKAP